MRNSSQFAEFTDAVVMIVISLLLTERHDLRSRRGQNRTIQNTREKHQVQARDLTDRTSKPTLLIMFVHIRDVDMNTKRLSLI